MDTPTRYAKISEKALNLQQEMNLTDVQTLLYDHICRGDFYLRNEDGQKFYCKDNNGFGWGGDRAWVKRQLKKLIDAGLVKFESVKDCRDGKYTSWYFWDAAYDRNDLVSASCYVSAYKLFLIRHYLSLPEGFNKRNAVYGDIEFIYKKVGRGVNRYTFKYKGEESIYSWDHNGKGQKKSLKWMNQCSNYSAKNPKIINQDTWITPMTYETFGEMIHDIWSFLAHEGKTQLMRIPGTTDKRQFTI